MLYRVLVLVLILISLPWSGSFVHHRRVVPCAAASQKGGLLWSSNTNINSNFVDEDVLCSSEGGSWRVDMASVSASSPLTGDIALPSSASASKRKESRDEGEKWRQDVSLALELLFSTPAASALQVTMMCDRIDAADSGSLAWRMLRLKRYAMLAELLRSDRNEYLETTSFLASRLARNELPNLQGVAVADVDALANTKTMNGEVADCALPAMQYQESLLDKALLGIFRGLVQKEVKYVSPQEGIVGLLDEGRTFMLSEQGTPDNQHAFVRRTLAALMTPVLPPFYRIFMSGIVPSEERGDPKWLVDAVQSLVQLLPPQTETSSVLLPTRATFAPGKQLGPLFYAPLLTSLVTPVFLSFLVGPSRANLRVDGQVGGIVVEKCKFLQESNCKGLCLHQCKLPAQQFFVDSLGLPLTVEPNFETQECQWSWGQVPLPPDEDPAFPAGCLEGCPTKKTAASSSSSSSSSRDLSKLCSA